MCVFAHQRSGSEPAPTSRTILAADAAVDAMGTSLAPAVVLVDNHRIEAIGTPASIGHVADTRRVDLPGHCLLPGLVNAHAHLDLSGPGPIPPETDFRRWLGSVRDLRAGAAPGDRAAAARRGIELLLAGGTVAVGDIVAHPADEALEVLRASKLRGVAWVEAFGLGDGQAAAIDRFTSLVPMDDPAARIRIGCSPHAPYSCTEAVYAAAAATDLAIATHLAETEDELRCLREGTGPLHDLLIEDVGLKPDALERLSDHPVPSLIDHLHGALCVHLNCIEPAHARLLAQAGAIACLCPRATAYFGRAMPGPLHILREAGVRIVLGTDSLLCLDTPDRICMLDEMRALASHVPAIDLLKMATCDGASSLKMDRALVDLRPGPTAGIIAVPIAARAFSGHDALDQVLASNAAPIWAMGPT